MEPEEPADATLPAPCLPRVGCDVLLVGDSALTGRLAAALLEEDEEDDGDGDLRSAAAPALPPAVARLRRRLEQNRTVAPSLLRRIHLVDVVNQVGSILRTTYLDHIILVTPYSATRSSERRELGDARSVVEALPRSFALQDRVTLVAVPTYDDSDAVRPEPPSPDAVEPSEPSACLPVLVCRLEQRQSRRHVVEMLWRRVVTEPCTRLVTLQLR